MTITVLSGKGGAGKTTVAAQLFLSSRQGVFLDADTEEPNAMLLLKGEKIQSFPVTQGYPLVDDDLCNHCGECAKNCRFHAILSTPDQTIPMASLCHDCGVCSYLCPTGAIHLKQRELGSIREYRTKGGTCYSGILNVGEMSGVRIIRSLLQKTENSPKRWIDGPPGTACAASASLDETDYAVVVADPTPFGLRDMQMVLELLKERGIPFGVVVNKSNLGNGIIQKYCREQSLLLLGEIPFRRDWARQLADGTLPDDSEWKKIFTALSKGISLQTQEEQHVCK